MAKTISEYLIEKTRGDLNQVELARAVNVSQSFLSRLKSGQNKTADISFAVDLARYFHEPLDRVLALLGKREYYDRLKAVFAKEFEKEPVLRFNMPDAELEGVKVFEDPICLGPGYNMDELKPAGYMPIPKADLPRGYKSDKDRILCFRTSGYSMEPTINDDSYVWIDRMTDDAQPGRIYAFLLDDNTVTVKRLLSLDQEYLVIGADNCAQEGFPKVLRLRPHDEPSIVRGRVVWIMNRLIPKPKK